MPNVRTTRDAEETKEREGLNNAVKLFLWGCLSFFPVSLQCLARWLIFLRVKSVLGYFADQTSRQFNFPPFRIAYGTILKLDRRWEDMIFERIQFAPAHGHFHLSKKEILGDR